MTYISSENAIATEIIRRAVKRGYSPRPDWPDLMVDRFEVSRSGMKAVTWFTESGSRLRIPLYELIFDHEFAKTVFGQKQEDYGHLGFVGGRNEGQYIVDGIRPRYQNQLTEMVLVRDPISYIAEQLGITEQRL